MSKKPTVDLKDFTSNEDIAHVPDNVIQSLIDSALDDDEMLSVVGSGDVMVIKDCTMGRKYVYVCRVEHYIGLPLKKEK